MKIKIISFILTLFIISNIYFPNVSFAESDSHSQITVDLSKETDNSLPIDDGKNYYITGTPTQLDRLPQTGEIITSFLVLLFGFSLILFTLNIIFLKYYISKIGLEV